MKKVFIGVFAALMLFAFVACDNSPSGMVYSIDATQTAVYVTGEEPTAEGFTFTGYTNLGESVSIDASQVKFVPYGTGSNSTYAIMYRGTLAGYVDVDFETLDYITVDATDSDAEYYAMVTGTAPDGTSAPDKAALDKAIDKTGIVVTAYYDGGSKVLPNDTKGLAFTADSWAGDTATITVSFNGQEDTYDVDVKENLIAGLTLNATPGYTVYYHKGGSTTDSAAIEYEDSPWAENASGIYMVAEYEGGQQIVLQSSDNAVEFQTGLSGSAPQYGNLAALNNTLAEENGIVVVTGRYVTTKTNVAVGVSRVATSPNITIAKDSMADIKFDTNSNSTIKKLNYTLSNNNPASGTFTFKAVWASGTETTPSTMTYNNPGNTTPAATDNFYTFSPADLSSMEVGDRYNFTVNATVNGYSDQAELELVVSSN